MCVREREGEREFHFLSGASFKFQSFEFTVSD